MSGADGKAGKLRSGAAVTAPSPGPKTKATDAEGTALATLGATLETILKQLELLSNENAELKQKQADQEALSEAMVRKLAGEGGPKLSGSSSVGSSVTKFKVKINASDFPHYNGETTKWLTFIGKLEKIAATMYGLEPGSDIGDIPEDEQNDFLNAVSMKLSGSADDIMNGVIRRVKRDGHGNVLVETIEELRAVYVGEAHERKKRAKKCFEEDVAKWHRTGATWSLQLKNTMDAWRTGIRTATRDGHTPNASDLTNGLATDLPEGLSAFRKQIIDLELEFQKAEGKGENQLARWMEIFAGMESFCISLDSSKMAPTQHRGGTKTEDQSVALAFAGGKNEGKDERTDECSSKCYKCNKWYPPKLRHFARTCDVGGSVVDTAVRRRNRRDGDGKPKTDMVCAVVGCGGTHKTENHARSMKKWKKKSGEDKGQAKSGTTSGFDRDLLFDKSFLTHQLARLEERAANESTSDKIYATMSAKARAGASALWSD